MNRDWGLSWWLIKIKHLKIYLIGYTSLFNNHPPPKPFKTFGGVRVRLWVRTRTGDLPLPCFDRIIFSRSDKGNIKHHTRQWFQRQSPSDYLKYASLTETASIFSAATIAPCFLVAVHTEGALLVSACSDKQGSCIQSIELNICIEQTQCGWLRIWTKTWVFAEHQEQLAVFPIHAAPTGTRGLW